MRLFHQLTQTDQHNAIHYCMHMVIEDMLDTGVEIEPETDADKEMCTIIEKALADAKLLPATEQFEFMVTHEDAGHFIFDLSLDMARSAYYHSDDEISIHYESLRAEMKHDHSHEDGEEVDDDMIEKVEELLTDPKPKGKHHLN